METSFYFFSENVFSRVVIASSEGLTSLMCMLGAVVSAWAMSHKEPVVGLSSSINNAV